MDERQKTMLNQQMMLQRGAAIIEGTNDNFRQDGYSNLLNKFGTKQDNSVAYQYNQEFITDDMELIRLYEGNGLFAKIIDRPSEEAVKHGFDIDYGDEDVAEYVDDRMDDLDFEAKFSTAEKWARLYGGSIIVMLVDDGRGLEEPLDLDNVRTIEELRVFERAIVQPDYTSMYQFHFLDTVGGNRPFAEPEFYQVFSIYGYFVVHRSRCLVFRNGRLPEQTTNAIYRYWGIPEYVKIKRALRECITSHEDGVKLLERSVQAIYKMKNLANLLSTEDGENKALQRLQVIDMARGILNSIAIDSDGEDYDFKTLAMAGVKDVIDATCNMLSAVTEIPQTILFGRSPAGMNSTGESDMENYYNMVENIQKQNMKKNARTVIDLILRQGKLEGRIPELPKYKVKFAALWSMSDAEKANVDKTKADTEYVKAQTSQLYMDSSVLDPSEVRKSLASEGDFEIEEVLSEEELNLPEDTFDVGDMAATGKQIEIIEQENDEGSLDTIDIDMSGSLLKSRETVVVKGINDVTNCTDDINVIAIKMDGGPGSGNFGHTGRPGKIGGSAKENNTINKKPEIRKAEAVDKGVLTSDMRNARENVKISTPDGNVIKAAFEDYDPLAIANKYVDKISNAKQAGDYETAFMLQERVLSENNYNLGKRLKKLGTYMEDGYYVSEDGLGNPMSEVFLRGSVNASAGCFNMRSAINSSSRDDIAASYLGDKFVKITADEAKARLSVQAQVANTDYTFGGISSTDESIIKTYTYATAVNSALRKGTDSRHAEQLRSIIDRTTSPERTVYRGIQGKEAEKIKDIDVGGTYSDKGFMSTSYNKGVAESFAGDNGVVLKIKTAAGYGKSFDVGAYSLKEYEEEVLLNAGSSLKVVSKHGNVIECEMVQNINHDGADYPAAAVLIIKDGRILCASRRNNEGVCGPGGHVEDGESTEDAAVREAMEEFNIVPLNLQPVGEYKGSTGSYEPCMVYWTDQFSGTPEADGAEMLNARWMSPNELQDQLLFPPFEESVKMLINLLTGGNADATLTSRNTDGGPGSGRYPKGSSGNLSNPIAPDKSDQKLNFQRTGNSMSVTKDVKFRSGTKISSGSKITKIADFAGGNSGKPVKVEEHLIKQYGGSKGSWTHSRGETNVTLNNGINRRAEIHWFESANVGQIDMKVKRYF